MYHSIFFGEKNTWDDWHMVPTSRPVVNPPTQKTNYLDIPGSDSGLDLSESLTGYPVYNYREGTFEFLVMNDYQSWDILYADILEYLHGKKMRMVLEDDREYFYEGHFEIKEWKSTYPWSTINIGYKVSPYKWNVNDSNDSKWLWKPFNFKTGVIRSSVFKDIVVDTDDWLLITFNKRQLENAPICPEFIVSSTDGLGITIKYSDEHFGINKEVHLNDGSHVIPEFIFYGRDEYPMYFKGHGTVSMKFRTGRL